MARLTEAEASAEMNRLFMTKGRNPDPDPRETPTVQKANAAAFQRDLDAARYDPETKFDVRGYAKQVKARIG